MDPDPERHRLSTPVTPRPLEAIHPSGELDIEDPEPETRSVHLRRRSDWRSPGYAPYLHARSHEAVGIDKGRLILFAPKASPPA